MAVYTLTLVNVRDRVEYKLRDDRAPTQVDYWINDVIQMMTAEIWFTSLYVEGVVITGDGSAQAFDLPEDFAAMSWMYSQVIDQPLDEMTPRELIEETDVFDANAQSPRAYAMLGRSGTAGANGIEVFQVKFDSVPASAEEIDYAYYRLHPLLSSDSDPIYLPTQLLSTVVDGVLMEADSWNDSDQFQMHRDRFLDKMNQMKRNQNRLPNKRRTMGVSSRSFRGRPGRPSFPSGYPSVEF